MKNNTPSYNRESCSKCEMYQENEIASVCPEHIGELEYNAEVEWENDQEDRIEEISKRAEDHELAFHDYQSGAQK